MPPKRKRKVSATAAAIEPEGPQQSQPRITNLFGATKPGRAPINSKYKRPNLQTQVKEPASTNALESRRSSPPTPKLRRSGRLVYPGNRLLRESSDESPTEGEDTVPDTPELLVSNVMVEGSPIAAEIDTVKSASQSPSLLSDRCRIEVAETPEPSRLRDPLSAVRRSLSETPTFAKASQLLQSSRISPVTPYSQYEVDLDYEDLEEIEKNASSMMAHEGDRSVVNRKVPSLELKMRGNLDSAESSPLARSRPQRSGNLSVTEMAISSRSQRAPQKNSEADYGLTRKDVPPSSNVGPITDEFKTGVIQIPDIVTNHDTDPDSEMSEDVMEALAAFETDDDWMMDDDSAFDIEPDVAMRGQITDTDEAPSPQKIVEANTSGSDDSEGTIVPIDKLFVADADENTSLLLSNDVYGIPEEIITAYARHGITTLYPWQAECLQLEGVLDGSKNLLYSAPTSGGKSLVADIVMLKKVLKTRRKAIMIVPFVALASERTKAMQNIFASQSLNIVGYYSDVGAASFDAIDIAYCTIEKANSLVNKLQQENKLEELGIVVVDELHMAGDPQRGYLLELLLTKLSFILAGQLQVVGMSATLPNINIFERWLDAHLYVTDFRPVPLTEYIKFGNSLYDSEGNLLKGLGKPNTWDPDLLLSLVVPTVEESASVLIFCPASKRYCENTAKLLSNRLPRTASNEVMEKRRDVVRELERTPGSLDTDLANYIMAGVAFHHAGLITEEKEIIEDAYRAGVINVIACTSTLAMGVNLPARRVIFRDLKKFRGELISPREYQQMRGRAGRKGLDSHGESIIMCSDKYEFAAAQALISSDLHPVTSCLLTDVKGMKRALLEVVVAGVVSSLEDMQMYLRYTLLYAEHGEHDEETHNCLLGALTFLETNRFIGRDENQQFRPTRLGRAAVFSSLSPEEALVVYDELHRASERFALNEELHTVYLVTPVYMDDKYVDWNKYAELYADLTVDNARKNVADLVGINEISLYRARKRRGWSADNDASGRAIHKRFYIAMILNDLVQEKPFDLILHKYPNISRGDLQSLQMQSGTFAGMVKIFCQHLGWDNLVAILDKFQDRLNFGVTGDLVDLMQIPEIGGARARMLYAAGFKDVTSLAAASPDAIFEALRKGSPFHPADNDREAQKRLLYRAAHMISQGAVKVVHTQLQQAAVDAQRKRNLLARVRDLASPMSARTQKGRTPIISSANSVRTPGSALAKRARMRNIETPCPRVGGPVAVDTPVAVQPTPLGAGRKEGDRPYIVSHATASESSFKEVLSTWIAKKSFVWHIHCVPSKSSGRLQPRGLSICWDPETVYYMDTTSKVFSWRALQPVFEIRSVKICFDAKSHIGHLLENKVVPVPTFRDPKIANWLLEPDMPERSLQGLFEAHLVKPPLKGDPLDIMSQCSKAAWQTYKLMETLYQRICAQGLDKHFVNIEMPIAFILAKMQHVGIGIQLKDIQKCTDIYRGALASIESQAHKLAGTAFNLTEGQEVAKVLYDVLQLPYDSVLDPATKREDDKRREKGKNVFRRTSKEILEKLKDHHPLPAMMMEHRRLSKLAATHLVPLQIAKVTSGIFAMDRIHCTFQTHTATGRVTTTNPNLQSIPHPRRAGDGLDIESVNIRNAFCAAEGMIFVSADYGQVELRIIAHMSGDEKLIALIHSGGDFFCMLAAELMQKKVGDVQEADRDRAKACTYGVMYGKGPIAIAEDLNIPLTEAEGLIRTMDEKYPGVAAWKRRTVQMCHENGYVETLLGRRRYLPDIHSKTSADRAHAERQSINTTVQGSAADLIKVAMAHLVPNISTTDKQFRERRWGMWLRDDVPANTVPHLILQIHDELLYEVPLNLVDVVRPIIRDCMEKTCDMRVPVNVRLKTGKTWGNLN
ncbi:uncharacterized protein EV422DRAFT_566714 [Fimicolochytrium jonesii]|uniref:uncharacterized protein n=1 Tax=Fimicolochytrium jonesii TaxID=1396493 RepID=UPI0022FE6CDC|nr:uncharacterized protein EV422DRAFT_566714 [Fimicolochytrium jonesii]KAI8821629.1 hypothetical protein EV422DRAFT_566714 [Fimicolochytrium jonesii]